MRFAVDLILGVEMKADRNDESERQRGRKRETERGGPEKRDEEEDRDLDGARGVYGRGIWRKRRKARSSGEIERDRER